MTPEEEYREDLAVLVNRISGLNPPDLDARFSSCFGIGSGSYLQVKPAQEGTVAAVDGSNAMLFDAGCISVALLRAGGMRVLCRYPPVPLGDPPPVGLSGAGSP